MEERPVKRQRRTDSSTMWDRSESSNLNGDDENESVQRDQPRKQSARELLSKSKHFSESESKWDRSRKKEQDRDLGLVRGRDREQISHSDKERHQLRKEELWMQRRRSRSRSPTRDNSSRRNGLRERSPIHGRSSGMSVERRFDGVEGAKIRSWDSKGLFKTDTHRKPQRNREVSGNMELDLSMRDSDEELEVLMMKTMGFGNFRSTKNTKVPGNDKLYGVRKEKKAEYRQYMNRVGGFNRPLSPTR